MRTYTIGDVVEHLIYTWYRKTGVYPKRMIAGEQVLELLRKEYQYYMAGGVEPATYLGVMIEHSNNPYHLEVIPEYPNT